MNASVVPRAPANPLELPWNALNVNQAGRPSQADLFTASRFLRFPCFLVFSFHCK